MYPSDNWCLHTRLQLSCVLSDHMTRIITWLSGDASAVADTTRGVRSIRFHPNGQHLAVGDRAGNLKWAGGHSLLCCHGSESGHQLEWPSDMTYVVVYLTLSQGRGSKHELEGSGDYWVLSWLCQISCLVWTNQWDCAVMQALLQVIEIWLHQVIAFCRLSTH